MDPLGEVRDRLERRRALQRDLQAQVDELATEIEALRAQGERTAAVLQSEREQARALEQRLDRLVPRLLARMADLEERRAQAARVLAEFAGRSRSVHLTPTVRARMLALSPVMLERLRGIEERVVSLRGDRDRIIERHEQIERRLAELTGAQRRVERERVEKRAAQQAAAHRLHAVTAEVRLLHKEQARLTRGFRRDDATMTARAEPRAERRTPADLGQPGAITGVPGSTGGRPVAQRP